MTLSRRLFLPARRFPGRVLRLAAATFAASLLAVLLVAATLPGSGLFRESPGAAALGITLDEGAAFREELARRVGAKTGGE